MAKLITLILLGIVAYLAFRRWNARKEVPSRKEEARPEPIVACEHCGIHVPLSESVQIDGRHYCSEDHLRRGSAERKP